MLMSKLPSALALVMLAGSLAACQITPPNSGPLPKAPTQSAPLILPASLDISQANEKQGSDPLNLTEQQRQQFATISQEAQRSDRSAELQRLLLAPQVDPAAIRSQLAQTDSDIANTIDTQLKLRNVLTPEQRQTLIANFRQASQSTDGGPSESQLQTMRQELKLTDEQNRLLTAMNDALKRHAEANRTRLRDAQVALLQSGDAALFRSALAESNRTMPLDAIVAYFTSLSPSQRQSLFSTSSGSTSGS